MNCKQLDELLPLYAGRDLDEKRARLVSEHVQICSTCARVAGEYRDAVELAQHFAPPVFSDNVYASVRRQVMQQIEAEPTTPLLPWRDVCQLVPPAHGLGSRQRAANRFWLLRHLFSRQSDGGRSASCKKSSGGNPEQTPESMTIPRTTELTARRDPGSPRKTNAGAFVNRSPLTAVRKRRILRRGRRVFRRSCATLRPRTVCRLSMQPPPNHLCASRFRQRIRTFASSGFLNRNKTCSTKLERH